MKKENSSTNSHYNDWEIHLKFLWKYSLLPGMDKSRSENIDRRYIVKTDIALFSQYYWVMGIGVFNTALFKKNEFFCLNEYSGFWKNEYFVWMNILDFKKMNILFEWIFWIFVKWMIFWTNTLVLVCRRQKWLLPNVSKSSEIIQGSIVGPNSVHFRGSFTYTGASGGLRSHFLALFWNFE